MGAAGLATWIRESFPVETPKRLRVRDFLQFWSGLLLGYIIASM